MAPKGFTNFRLNARLRKFISTASRCWEGLTVSGFKLGSAIGSISHIESLSTGKADLTKKDFNVLQKLKHFLRPHHVGEREIDQSMDKKREIGYLDSLTAVLPLKQITAGFGWPLRPTIGNPECGEPSPPRARGI